MAQLPLLHAKGRDLHKRVRTRFKDHADDTDRHCGTIERQIFVKLAGEGDLIEGICERFQLAQAADAVAQLAVVEFQAFARRASDTIFVSSSEILRIGSKNLLAMRFQREGRSVPAQHCALRSSMQPAPAQPASCDVLFL